MLNEQAQKDRISQLFSFGRYKSINKTKSERGKRVLTHILNYTIDLLMIVS